MTDDRMQKFTQRARYVLTLALKAAEHQHSPTIETGHILIGLIREPGGAAGHTLRALGFDPIVMHSRSLDTDAHPQAAISLSPDVKRMLEIAVDEAHAARSRTINTEHFLLALLRLDQSDAYKILHQAGLTAAQIRAELTRFTDPKISEDNRGPYSQPTGQKTDPKPTDPAAHHINLLTQRIARHGVGPNITLTSVIAFIGYFLSATLLSALIGASIRSPLTIGLEIATYVIGWGFVLVIPPLVGVLTSMVIASDIQQGTPQLLALTNLSPNSILWGYVRGMLYRFRLFFTAIIAIAPVYISESRNLYIVLFPLFNQSPIYMAFQVSALAQAGTLPLIFIPLSLTWFAITAGITFAFRSRDAVFAATVAALVTLILLLAMLLLPMLLVLAIPDPMKAAELVSAAGLVMPLLAGLAGLILIKRSENTIYAQQ